MSIDVLFMGVLFIMIHLFGNKFIPADRIKRVKWLSFSGGLAVSYVFVYVLPSLHQNQQYFGEQGGALTMESELYFFGLVGLLIYYGVEKVEITKEEVNRNGASPHFILRIIFFTIYNLLISYTVVVSYVEGIQALFYSFAIGFHFISVAHDLWQQNPTQYNQWGRYILAFGVVSGWVTGSWITLSVLSHSLIFAFISGAMILIVLKNELPEEKDAHFLAFAFGIISYSFITIALQYFFQW
ncbi:MAG: hypothetical protein LRY73_00475 [Bacillus sp. (in: Bacteria)]|nr:hypothetical protein [Bacillus sp. (in: firmicutes)]